MLLVGRRAAADRSVEPFGLHGASLATGLVTVTLAWTMLDYLAASSPAKLPVVIALSASGLAVLVKWRGPRLIPSRAGLFFAVTAAAVALGLWLHLPADLPSDAADSHRLFSDLQFDLSVHALLAEFVRDSGLPLLNPWANAGSPVNALSHSAHAVAMAGVADSYGLGTVRAATILWVVAAVLTVWSAAELFERRQAGRAATILGCLAVTVWGPLAAFDPAWLLSPPADSRLLGTQWWVAGRSFWNLTQALSVAVVMAAVTLVDRLDDPGSGSRRHLALLTSATALIAASAWFKPSLVILFGPALLVWAALRREPPAAWLAIVLAMALGLAVYALPALGHSLPPGGRWLLEPDARQISAVAEYAGRALAAPIVAVALLGTAGRRWRPVGPLALASLALAGSVLFAVLFREQQFVGFRVLQPNIWWGIAACTLIVLPLVAREVPSIAEIRRPWPRLALVAGLALAAAQIAHGIAIATAYPLMIVRTYPTTSIALLERARALTTPDTRIAVDPFLDALDLRPFLARRSLLPVTIGEPADLQAYADWTLFVQTGRGDPRRLLERLDAVIVHEGRRAVHGVLAALQWRPLRLGPGFVLWRRPAQNG